MSYDTYELTDLPSDRLKLLLHGAQGHGKTTTGISIAERCKTVVIDLPGEKGLRSVKQVPYANNIKVIRPKSTDQLTEVFWDAQTASGPFNGAEAVVLESGSAYAQMCIRKILGVPEDTVRPIEDKIRQMQIQDWGTLLSFMTDLATFWFGLADSTSPNPMHVIFTCQSKRIEDNETGEVKVTLDVSEGSRGPLLSNPDYIGYCFVEKGESADLMTENWQYKVRFGPHDSIATKIHEDKAVNEALVSKKNGVLGGFGDKALTIPKFCKMFKIPL